MTETTYSDGQAQCSIVEDTIPCCNIAVASFNQYVLGARDFSAEPICELHKSQILHTKCVCGSTYNQHHSNVYSSMVIIEHRSACDLFYGLLGNPWDRR